MAITQDPPKARLLILVIAYNSERTIETVVRRIPLSLSEFETEILIIDDSSHDRTFDVANDFQKTGQIPYPLTILHNPAQQGYGGIQKIGFHYAIEKGFDVVALFHASGQYAPERLTALLDPLLRNEADAVFGSRMTARLHAIKGGMPLYKYVGNRILSGIQNRLLQSSLSEFHCGYRLYSVAALRQIPFDHNTDDFHFDTEITIQLFRAGYRIQELPVPAYDSDEIRRVNGIRYAWNVLKSTVVARFQDLGILYERKFDVKSTLHGNPLYQSKFSFESPHTLTLDRIPPGAKVADIGCAAGYMSRALQGRGCRLTGVDMFPLADDPGLERFVQCDLNNAEFPLDAGEFDYILLLDFVEHLRSPERFVDSIRHSRVAGREVKVIMSTGNIGFIVTRLALLFGWFNYGPRGILDLTHTRLFTFATARRLFEQSGYRVEEIRGVPAPFPLVLGDGFWGKFAVSVNRFLIRVSKTLFAYQIFIVCTPLPSLEWLLARARASTKNKLAQKA